MACWKQSLGKKGVALHYQWENISQSVLLIFH